MLHVHFSNRYEALVDILRDRLDARDRGVFAADQVIVPSAAVRRSLTLALADQYGICANVEFAFLARWLWQQIRRVVPDAAPESPFAPEVLAWRIHAAFLQPDWLAVHPRLHGYLDGADDVMRYDLACRVAAVFDQYLTYRPQWLQAWAEGRPAGPLDADATTRADAVWQAALWRQVMAQIGLTTEHPADRFIAIAADAEPGALAAAAVPSAAHVFALPAMPPMHLRVLRELARHADIHLYVVNPCREYWFEIIPPRRLNHLAARGNDAAHEVGNRLLSGWGRQTQSHIDLLIDQCGDAANDDGAFAPSDGHSLLARLQNSILDLVELAPGSAAAAAGDRSVEVHVCHSLTRELEVLHDRLLGLFAADPGLRPSQIAVVMPALDTAAPLIDAVFGTVPRERHIPYAITGRARAQVSAPARAMLDLLALPRSRFTASALFGLLQQPIVARRFGLDDDGLQHVHAWLQTAGLRWALDADQRSQFGLPPDPRHTVADALDRLFLGYALPDDMAAPVLVGDDAAGERLVLPCGNAEGSDAVALGSLAAFVAALRQLCADCANPRTAEDWTEILLDAAGDFLAPAAEEIDDAAELDAAVRRLDEDLRNAGVIDRLPLEVVRTALEQRFDDPAHGGVAGGGVTFTSISSLRSVPFEWICVIGLDDGRFPTAARPHEFDLIARQPQRGDRQRRIDERNLFLDLLAAARRGVHLSYTGRSVRDNSPLPPSVLVAELLDVLVPAVAADPQSPADCAAARASLVVEHPLQPFSPLCFSAGADPRLRSHDAALAAALRAGAEQSAAARTAGAAAPSAVAAADDGDDDEAADDRMPPFFTGELPAPDDKWRDVSLGQLLDFYRNPCRFLLRHRLGIDLWRDDELIEDDEPLLPDRDQMRALMARLLPALLAGAGADEVRRLARAGIEIPSGHIGERNLAADLDELHRFADGVRAATGDEIVPPQHLELTFDLGGENWRLHTAFTDLRASGLVRWRFEKQRPGIVLDAWLHHLALCAMKPPRVACESRWLLRDDTLHLAEVPGAGDILGRLVEQYRRGLGRPLHFFPKSAWAYCDKHSRQKARDAWTQGDYPENADAAYRLALRGVADPIDDEFAELAVAVFGEVHALIDGVAVPS